MITSAALRCKASLNKKTAATAVMSLPLHTFIKPTYGKDRRQMTQRKSKP